MGRRQLAIDLPQFRAGRQKLLAGGPGPWQQPEILGFKRHALLLGCLQFLLPVGQLLVQKAQRRAGAACTARDILLLKNIDHFLGNVTGQAGGLPVRASTAGLHDADIDQIGLLRFHHDILAQRHDLAGHVRI